MVQFDRPDFSHLLLKMTIILFLVIVTKQSAGNGPLAGGGDDDITTKQKVASDSAPNQSLRFESDVRPILKAHCFHCHGEDGTKEGDLDLRLRRFIAKGGESGSSLTAGDSASSLLVQRLVDGEMPPDDKAIPAADIETIRKWIDQGAKTARPEPKSIDDSFISEEEKSFWAFQAVSKPHLPKFSNSDVAQTPIDAFILEKLNSKNLSFSPIAEKQVLIRRVYFDLIGLPPSPNEVDSFLKDTSVDAYEQLIDRLLSSPSYGERWGRHWLDVAGYADSEGYTDKDPERQFAFFYRDYVIESLNADKPYDEFVVEQMAGDELTTASYDQLTEPDRQKLKATGFLRMAPDGTASGGVDRNLATNETIADTIQIVSTSLFGLTVGCARCHNHRYDPIRQTDYYRIRAIFEPALDWKKWRTPKQRQISLYTESEKKLRSEIELQAKKLDAARLATQKKHIERTLYEELLVAPDEKRNILKSAYQTPKPQRTAEQIALLEEHPNIGNITAGSLYLYAEQRNRRAKAIETEANRREKEYLAAIREEHLAKVPSKQLESVKQTLQTPAEKRTSQQLKWVEKYPAIFAQPVEIGTYNESAAKEIAEYRIAAERCRKLDAKTELAKMADEAAKLRSTAPREFFVRALTEPENHLPTTVLFKRGNHNQPADVIAPGELEIFSNKHPVEILANDENLKSSGRRLAYAKHLVSGNHPLVARVFVNRVWMQHFGRGIVETPGDFGMLGARPTHLKLLDWLATDFVESGWNIKRLHRKILLSRTYQQSSQRNETLDQLDPDNRLYGRMSIRRLESESIRDSLLSISGQYVNKMLGPPIPVKEDAVGQVVLGKQKLDGERKPQPGNKLGSEAERRSIYIQVRRTRPLAVLETFDIATNAPNCTVRNDSNVAPQSLLLMNSEFSTRYSDQLAERIQREKSGLESQLQYAIWLCYSREADKPTIDAIIRFVNQQKIQLKQDNPKRTEAQTLNDAIASACHAIICANEFFYID